MAEADPIESWRDIEGFPGYQISDQGNVRSFWRPKRAQGRSGFIPSLGPTPRLRKPCPAGNGYAMVYLRRGPGAVRRNRYVHQLVLLAFVGPRPAGMECRHLNDCPTDNRLVNLAWGTPRQNRLDALGNGRNQAAKLDPAKVREIRRLYAAGARQVDLAARFGVHQTIISDVVRRVTWRHVD